MPPDERDQRWSHIAELLARPGGTITLGRIAPIEGAAIAIDEQTLFASLMRREGESVEQLLRRLDEAVGAALHQGAITNEINGGNFRLARPHTRERR